VPVVITKRKLPAGPGARAQRARPSTVEQAVVGSLFRVLHGPSRGRWAMLRIRHTVSHEPPVVAVAAGPMPDRCRTKGSLFGRSLWEKLAEARFSPQGSTALGHLLLYQIPLLHVPIAGRPRGRDPATLPASRVSRRSGGQGRRYRRVWRGDEVYVVYGHCICSSAGGDPARRRVLEERGGDPGLPPGDEAGGGAGGLVTREGERRV
jgi:hypothetical protein